MVVMEEYAGVYLSQIVELIVGIQQQEFGLPIGAADQPDLQNIPAFYQQGHGNFWVAVDDKQVVGTIALIDIGEGDLVLRKMFVAPAYRGKEKTVAQQLMNTVINWCHSKHSQTIYLGTIDVMKAAHRFYERNGFVPVEKAALPARFPLMRVDNVFYKYSVKHS